MNSLKVVSRDILNTFLYADILEKVYIITELEISKREEYIVEIVKNMCRMSTALRV